MIVAGNKVDIAADRSGLEALKAHVESLGMPFYEISAAAQQGTRELMFAAARQLEHLPPITVYEPTYVERSPEVDTSEPLSIVHEDDTWIVEGPWLQRLMANVNFGDYESRNWLTRCSVSPACLTGWRRWASRTGTSSRCTTWNLNISAEPMGAQAFCLRPGAYSSSDGLAWAAMWRSAAER